MPRHGRLRSPVIAALLLLAGCSGEAPVGEPSGSLGGGGGSSGGSTSAEKAGQPGIGQQTGGNHGAQGGVTEGGGGSTPGGGTAAGNGGTTTEYGGVGGDGDATGGSGGGGAAAGPTPQVRAGCESVEYGGHLYALCRDQMVPFPQARMDCEAMNMQLIRVDSAAEDAWIYETFFAKELSPNQDNYQMWLGGTDSALEGQWRWLRGGDPFWQGAADGGAVGGLYENWGRPYEAGPPNQPNDMHSAEGEDCVVIRGPLSTQVVSGTWVDVGCGTENSPPDMDNRKGWYTCESS